MSKKIAVTGATGTIGKRVVEGLVARKESVVGLVRSAAKGAALEALGAQVALASFEEQASLEPAFAGVDTVVLITAANANAAEQNANALAAARKAGVRKIVRISALKAAPDGPTDNTRQHARTEAAVRASGLTHVILRPHLFLQNLLASLPTIVGQGRLFFGAGEARMGMIDTRDVADAAVVAATTDRFDGETIELTGPASIDFHTAAAAVGRGLGREVTYVPVPPDAVAQAVRQSGADEWTAGIVRDYCIAYSKGWGDFTTEDVARVTGHAPRSVDDFVREVLVPAARG